jgi:hypothetical protein
MCHLRKKFRNPSGRLRLSGRHAVMPAERPIIPEPDMTQIIQAS